jgi:hypothetical protein
MVADNNDRVSALEDPRVAQNESCDGKVIHMLTRAQSTRTSVESLSSAPAAQSQDRQMAGSALQALAQDLL